MGGECTSELLRVFPYGLSANFRLPIHTWLMDTLQLLTLFHLPGCRSSMPTTPACDVPPSPVLLLAP